MARAKDPRGILTFIIRYLVLHVAFLIGLPISREMDVLLFYFFGFMGFFTFIQVLVSISQKFLVHGGVLKFVAVLCAIATDVPILWYFGWVLKGLFPGGNDWSFVVNWMPFHFGAAFAAWGLREIIHAVSSGGTAEPRNPSGPIIPSRPTDQRASVDPGGPADPGGPTDPDGSASPSGSEDADAPTVSPTDTNPKADDR